MSTAASVGVYEALNEQESISQKKLFNRVWKNESQPKLSSAVLMVVIHIAIYHNFKENEKSYLVELLKLMDWTWISFIWQL